MNLEKVVEKLETFAPLSKAEPCDNVGLLITPATSKDIKTIFLTNDLTEPVLDEALEKKSDMIISYYPPIFAPFQTLNRIAERTWTERLVSICLENRIALYSPHTAWDVAEDGINDWLANAFECRVISPIKPFTDNPKKGVGLMVDLWQSRKLRNIIDLIKQHTNVPTIHLAIKEESDLHWLIDKIAICAGARGSLLNDAESKANEAELYLTGEMSHHEVFHATQNGISVILCNNYSGFLKKFKLKLNAMLDGKCDIIVSEINADQLSSY